jgi:hypothetical protein
MPEPAWYCINPPAFKLEKSSEVGPPDRLKTSLPAHASVTLCAPAIAIVLIATCDLSAAASGSVIVTDPFDASTGTRSPAAGL